MGDAYRAICCSNSSILARLERFFGLALGAAGGGVDSLLSNQSDNPDFVENSFSS